MNRHDLARQAGDAVLDFGEVHGERAVRLRDEPALVEQIVQLDGDAFAVRLIHAEANGAERRRQIRRVERALERLRQHALVDQVLDREQPGDVRLRFLEKAVRLLQFLTDGGLAAADADAVRPEAVHQLVDDDVREEGVEGQVLLIAGRQDDLRDRRERLRELRVLDVLQHDALRALLADHALVVRQIERGGLHAAVAVAGRVDFVHDDDRRHAAELGIAVLRIDRQMVLDVL